MKIGIITFWESTDNYGQVLQCLALQQYLKEIGHDPFLIRYTLFEKGKRNKKNFLKALLKILLVYPAIRSYKQRKESKENLRLLKIIERKNKQRKFAEFRNKYINSTEHIYSTIDDLRNYPPKADCYITGSDQVWIMPLSNEHNKAFFLDFGPKTIKRISYAASFSLVKYPETQMSTLKEMLSRFYAISVREASGVDICNAVGANALHVVDPTMLIEASFYRKIASEVRVDTTNYMFLYSINIKDKEDIYWTKLSDYLVSKDIKPIVTTSSGHFPGRELIPGVDYKYATIPQWLALINQSDFVSTTSFHGVAFCLILNKNFIYFPLKGKNSQSNTRVISLLASLELESKICMSADDISKCVETDIDWNKVNSQLLYKIQQSQSFLIEALSNNKAL